MRNGLISLCVALLCLVPEISWAERSQGYFEKSPVVQETKPVREGYFFYTAPEPTAVELESEKKSPVPAQESAQVQKLQKYAGKVPWAHVMTMHPDDFQKLMEEQLKHAVQDPSDQKRVDDYVALQMVAINRAEQFQQAWARTLTRYPALDPTAQRPPTRVASQVALHIKMEGMQRVIVEMREKMGILVFTRPDCPFCLQQAEIMETFAQKWGWEHVQAIDITRYPFLSDEYGVSLVPDIFLVANLDGEVQRRRLRAGLTTVSELEAGLMEAYSVWFLNHPYMPQAQYEGQRAFDAHLNSLIDSSNPGRPEESENAPKLRR